jgi:hypothetical protein
LVDVVWYDGVVSRRYEMNFNTMFDWLMSKRKITHKNWNEGEYIYYKDGSVFSEDGSEVSATDILTYLACLSIKINNQCQRLAKCITL